MIHEVTDYFPWLGACLTVLVLIVAAAIFVLRLYLVESRVDRQWRDCEDFPLQCRSSCDDTITPDEAWWCAEPGETDSGADRLKRRRYALHKAVKILTIVALAACTLLIAGVLFAAFIE